MLNSCSMSRSKETVIHSVLSGCREKCLEESHRFYVICGKKERGRRRKRENESTAAVS